MGLAMYSKQVQTELRQYLAICDTGVPVIQQTVNDAIRMMEMAESAGMAEAVAEADALVSEGALAVELLTGLCEYVFTIVTCIENILVPALLAWVMTLCTWYNTFGA